MDENELFKKGNELINIFENGIIENPENGKIIINSKYFLNFNYEKKENKIKSFSSIKIKKYNKKNILLTHKNKSSCNLKKNNSSKRFKETENGKKKYIKKILSSSNIFDNSSHNNNNNSMNNDKIYSYIDKYKYINNLYKKNSDLKYINNSSISQHLINNDDSINNINNKKHKIKKKYEKKNNI